MLATHIKVAQIKSQSDRKLLSNYARAQLAQVFRFLRFGRIFARGGGGAVVRLAPPIRGQVVRRAGPLPTTSLLSRPANAKNWRTLKKCVRCGAGRGGREACGLVFTGAWRGGAGLNIFCGLRRRAALWPPSLPTKEAEKRRVEKKGRRKASRRPAHASVAFLSASRLLEESCRARRQSLGNSRLAMTHGHCCALINNQL